MEAIILAGGLGTRLRSVVSDIPKCMAPIGGQPFLWYVLRYLSRHEYDISRVILSVGYLREQIISWAEAHRHEYPFEIAFSAEDEPLGTGGAIMQACSYAAGRHVAVLNGDTLFDAPLDRLLAEHIAGGRAVTLALKEMHDFDRYGAVSLGTDGGICGFEEKRHRDSGLINGGTYIIDRKAGIFPEGKVKFSFEKEVLEPLANGGRMLGGWRSEGYFIDIGIPEDYTRAEAELPGMFPSRLADIDVSQYDTILLDRDGVINRLRRNDYVKSADEFELLPGVTDAIASWAKAGKSIYIMTNQRGVGKGVMSLSDLEEVHRHMTGLIDKAGGKITGIYVCTAVENDDHMRKPQPGMFARLLTEHPEVRPETCLMIGDSSSDMEFAANCGIRGVRI